MNHFLIEQKILSQWATDNTFQKQLDLNKNNPTFSFYDGPPFATGLPHYGHLVASTIKDIIPRYWAMNGFNVPRQWGWDCHGLPIEFEIEKKLGIKTKQEILKLGIKNYNQECQSIVMTYSNEWKKTISQLGRWVDMENPYKTMDLSFMNCVWKTFHQLYQKDLVYQGVKVMPYSTKCTTPLSNFEAKLNYKKVQDPSIIIKFKMLNTLIPTYFLVWTTTPWTLPSNQALCVNPELLYSVVEQNDIFYIILDSLKEKYEFSEIIKTIPGTELIGIQYEPLFPFFPNENGFKIVADKYVTNSTGTGIVHLAPAFGEDDYRVCLSNNIIDKFNPPPCPFNENGIFTNQVPFLENIFFKDADKIIVKNIKDKLFSQTTETHDYPFCWRSESPLMYRIVPCTFINVEKIKNEICNANSKQTNWVPEHIKEGRFGSWLKEAKDWCVSRNRYWGTPIPIWKSNDDIICISSVQELEELTGKKFNNIHREFIDDIEIEKDGKIYKRIEEVFDCWFESGSVPFHMGSYPADFIGEGLDQTRGWFYTLSVIGVALTGKVPFKNVIVNGLVLAEDGEKMSKSKKNYPEPGIIIEKYGADALRLYLISQNIVKGDSLKFKELGVKNIIQNIHIYVYNTLNFLKQMIPFFEQKFESKFTFTLTTNIMDLTLLNYLQEFVDDIHKEMKKYNLSNIVGRIEKFVGQLSRTYLNMNKTRLKSCGDKNDALESLSTLMYVLKVFSVMLAPFAPFMAENIYQEVRVLEGYDEFRSVHLEKMEERVWDKGDIGSEGLELMETIVEARGEIRAKVLKSAKKPIINQFIYINNWRLIPFLENIQDILQKECNTLHIEFSSSFYEVLSLNYDISMQELGKRFKKDSVIIGKKIKEYLDKHWGKCALEIKSGKIIIPIDEEEITFTNEINLKYEIDNEKVKKIFGIEMHGLIYKDIVILSDLSWNTELENIYLLKMFCRELMDFRKKCKLIPTDKVIVHFKNIGQNNFIEENIEKLKESTNMVFIEYTNFDKNKLCFELDENKYEFYYEI